MSKKNILNASSAAASFLSIPREAAEAPDKDQQIAKEQEKAGKALPAKETEKGSAGSAASERAETSRRKNAGRKKKTDPAAEGYITRTYYITRELDKSLGHFSIEQGMDKSAVVRAALDDYIRQHS